MEPESVRYNEVTLSLLMFVDGLAAILSKEIPARGDEVGKLLVTDASGNPIYVDGTREACLKWAKAVIRSIGYYNLKYADEIIRRSFTKVMALKVQHHFDSAVEMLVEYHPSHLRPSDEELRKAEEASRQKKAAGEKRRLEQLAAEAKKYRIARVGDDGGHPATPRGGKAKKIDASVAPCHGVAYHGVCNKEECPFDHDVARCKAFKEANPDGPPKKK